MNFAAERAGSLARYLRRHVAGEVRFDAAARKLYATDASHYRIEPAGVVVPKTADDVAVAVQIAADLNVPVTARGAGTSLTGQSIGPGIVLDCSKYLNAVSELDPASRTVRVQPGAVLDQLNREAGAHGLMFGPDVATASRATLGGMIGNNSAGARSVVYGQTVSHVRELGTVLADGSRARFGPLTAAAFGRKCELRTLEGAIYRDAAGIVERNAAAIRAAYPPILRKVSGYNLHALALAEAPGFDLVPLLVGSEGTLAVTTDAVLSLVPRPKYRGLFVPQFDTLRHALDAVGICLAAKPTAVELMDRMLLDLARKQRGLKAVAARFAPSAAAVLMVEFCADDPAAIEHAVEKLAADLRPAMGLTASITATDAADRDPLWNLRSGAVPLLYGLPGDAKPVTFCEDAAVAPERLPEFAERFRAIFLRHGTDGAFYGHASVGCLHIRPVLDLHDRGDVAKMRAIMGEVVSLVREFNGSLSGEHGDGLVRSEWNRPLFGDTVYNAFCAVKHAFDPGNVLNPGKVVHGPRMEENLRVPPGTTVVEPPTVFDYPAAGGFFRSVEACNGSAVCRKTQGGAMCPSYRVTKDEADTPRGRANGLRESIVSGPGDGRWLFGVMDLCLGCKACKTECPANVDVAKLKSEFLHSHYARRGRPPGDYLAKYVRPLSRIGAAVAGISNTVAARRTARRAVEAAAGIDRRRSLPTLHADHFRKKFRRTAQPDGGRRVLLLDDCFTTYQEPHIGAAALKVLNAGGVRAALAGVCCGRALISKGFLTEARAVARAGVRALYPFADAGVPILGLEPSCLLTLADEWPDLVPGPQATAVAAAAHLAEAWVAAEVGAGRFAYAPPPAGGTVLLHAHCHQKALVGPGGSAAALKLLPGLSVDVLDAGCCGMAGMFGYETRHYDLSIAVAELALAPAVRAAPDARICATGTSCRHQILDVTGRRARHPLELLAGPGTDPAGPAAGP